MKKIINPFVHSDKHDYKCFGCSPLNDIGLKLEFWDAGEEIICKWLPKKQFEGYLNVVHGGIQATIHDEIASWTVYTKCKTAGVTSNLDVRYKSPLMITDKEMTFKANVESVNKRLAIIKTTIEDGDGKICSIGKVTYFLFPQDMAKEKYQYPGVEAFYEN
ncbi:PaaI family thioesterase [Labilibacter marinus]|uniref:PaaI family thioesterase n=1 Tax=Labilibacter marinus TaxID=1477105 RepID=UPI0008322626|nr:PaaI family thioesterase [Labilibacter marinus]